MCQLVLQPAVNFYKKTVISLSNSQTITSVAPFNFCCVLKECNVSQVQIVYDRHTDKKGFSRLCPISAFTLPRPSNLQENLTCLLGSLILIT